MPGIPNRWSIVLQAFEKCLQTKASQYEHVQFASATIADGRTRTLHTGVLRFTRRGDPLGGPHLPDRLAAGQLDLGYSSLSIEQALALIRRGRRHTIQLDLEKMAFGPFSGEMVDPYFLTEQVVPRELRSSLEWPYRDFVFLRHEKNPLPLPVGKVGGSSSVSDLSYHRAIEKWTRFRLPRVGEEPSSALRVVLPDFRARITEISYNGVDVTATTENMLIPKEQISVHQGLGPSSIVMPVPEGDREERVVMSAPYEPPSLYVMLADRESNDVLDWARCAPFRGIGGRRVRIESEVDRTLRLIRLGEGPRIEFKHAVGNGDELLETVCAFANCGGGTLLLGVADNRGIVGCDPAMEQKRVEDMVHSRCDPPVDIDFYVSSVDEKRLLLIEVRAGPNPPYLLKPRGIAYIRRGSHDRPVTSRAELDEVYARRDASSDESRRERVA